MKLYCRITGLKKVQIDRCFYMCPFHSSLPFVPVYFFTEKTTDVVLHFVAIINWQKL